nr:GTP-binding protein Rhes [Misgurnus anguillicaudatus]
MIPARSMVVNTTDKPLTSVDGTEMLNSHPQGIATDDAHLQCLQTKARNRASSSVSLQGPDGHTVKLSSSACIIKTVTSHWRHPEKNARVVRSSSIENRHSSSERKPRRSLDPFAASQVHITKHMRCESKNDDLVSVKPSHYRRIVVLGAPRVGKTAVIRRFLGDGFEEQYEPTTEDFHSKLYHIRGERYQLDILDASKERDYPAKRRLSILTGDIFLLVFSVTDRESFNEVCALREEIFAAKSKLAKTKENGQIPIIICGNKIDLGSSRSVHRSDICNTFGEASVLFEVSAKDCTKLEKMFEALAVLGGLPTETRPSLHRDISIHTYQAMSNRKRNKRAMNEPCGAVHPLARRPSFNSDLRRVMGPTTPKRSTPIERCQIQ